MNELDRLYQRYGWRIQDRAIFDSGVWCLPSSHISVDYPDHARDLCAEIEPDSFWFNHRNIVIFDLLNHTGRPDTLWDIGAGNGWVSLFLQNKGIEVVSVEPGWKGIIRAAKRGVRTCIGASLADLHLPDNALEAVGCFDVIEHIEDPAPLVFEIWRVLRPGGLFILSVPALSWLWSETDLISGHYRRYTRSSLRKWMADFGFTRLHDPYMMFSLVFPLWIKRTIPYWLGRGSGSLEKGMNACAREVKPGKYSASFFQLLLRIERWIGRFVPPPMGTSLIAVYNKRV